MPSSYSANPAAIQTPSPLPGLGIIPIASLPVGTDPPNAASIYQPVKAVYDAAGFLLGEIARESWDWNASLTAAGAFEGVKGRWTFAATATGVAFACMTTTSALELGRCLILEAGPGVADTCSLDDAFSYGSLMSTKALRMDFRASLGTVGANNTTNRIGFESAVGLGNNRICFKRASGETNWKTETDLAGVTTTTDTGVAVVASVVTLQNRFTISATTTQVLFFIDGVLVATHTTNIPTVSLQRGISVVRTGSSGTGKWRVGPISVGVY